MLQPHSFLWHYFSIAPDVLLALLALLMWQRELQKKFPAFFCYAIFESLGGAVLYCIDVSPKLSATTYWRSYLLFLLIEMVVKFLVIGEVFTHLLRRYPSMGRVGKVLTSGVGISLTFTATLIAAFASQTPFWLISATRILSRSVSVVQCGLIIFLFVFAAYFHLSWERTAFGLTLGFAVLASVHLAYWALTVDWLLGKKSYLLDFLGMPAYQACVLIWFYFLLVPEKHVVTSAVPLPEHNLELWNRELERLLQQ
jgi:hypothetical protein